MTKLRWTIGFRLDTHSNEIRFDLTSGRERIRCRVSPEYLEDCFGPLRDIDDFFSGAEAFRSEILLAVNKRISARQFEADGSLLLQRFDCVPVA